MELDVSKSSFCTHVMKIDWLNICNRCSDSCCKGENVFFNKKELEKINNYDIKKQDTAWCQFNLNSKCSIYNDRPFECRIFPLDFRKKDNGNISFGYWKTCLGTNIDINFIISEFKSNILNNYSAEYIDEYMIFHKLNGEPEKYLDYNFIELEELGNIKLIYN